MNRIWTLKNIVRTWTNVLIICCWIYEPSFNWGFIGGEILWIKSVAYDNASPEFPYDRFDKRAGDFKIQFSLAVVKNWRFVNGTGKGETNSR